MGRLRQFKYYRNNNPRFNNLFDFTPNDYEIITFGSLIGADNLIINNGISPNNDGLNDTFVIKGIDS
ncbi:hypothetical protein FHS04_000820 [Mesoflavibacter sabulilitoris]|uniref:hypothetical protein n=1 Tax=Mesoflavibacter zeaxanthinifaciens TaxID=393060 RepID=UPI0011B1D4E8|nr:hypothetical protein [Mesoflavibacter zeaxanthinifaciens]MBB3123323.1 hypothetical protein [Mesoflavibacter zeaxanthinifaciens subsp. sabulilitoris]